MSKYNCIHSAANSLTNVFCLVASKTSKCLPRLQLVRVGDEQMPLCRPLEGHREYTSPTVTHHQSRRTCVYMCTFSQ